VRGAASPAIHTQDLAKRYGKTVALRALTMTVERGEVFGFLGPNGAGKTTAVKLLLGLAKPTGGEAWILGAPLGDLATRRRIGYLPELFRYQSWLRARDVLALHCALARIRRDRWRGEIDAALATVGLADRADDRIGTFSKGMQQRLGLGVALLGTPDLVLLDEPTSALDPVGRRDVREIIAGLKSRGVTVFLNSHLLTEVERVCDRVAIVDKGAVVAEGRVADIGAGAGVRVHVTDLADAERAALARFGPLETSGEWLRVRGLTDGAIPDLVAEIVRRGGRVHAVHPERATLEDRFLALLGEEKPS
jgi:ABC-2 type transport system ATP-binding protein